MDILLFLMAFLFSFVSPSPAPAPTQPAPHPILQRFAPFRGVDGPLWLIESYQCDVAECRVGKSPMGRSSSFQSASPREHQGGAWGAPASSVTVGNCGPV